MEPLSYLILFSKKRKANPNPNRRAFLSSSPKKPQNIKGHLRCQETGLAVTFLGMPVGIPFCLNGHHSGHPGAFQLIAAPHLPQRRTPLKRRPASRRPFHKCRYPVSAVPSHKIISPGRSSDISGNLNSRCQRKEGISKDIPSAAATMPLWSERYGPFPYISCNLRISL